MKNLKKLTALGLAAVMALSLGACKSSKKAAVDTGTGESGTAAASSSPESTGETIPLKWYMAGSGPQADVATVQNAVNE